MSSSHQADHRQPLGEARALTPIRRAQQETRLRAERIDRRIRIWEIRLVHDSHRDNRGHIHERVTVRNLEIIDVDTEDNVLVVKGAVPGPNGGYVVVRRAKR